jgi:citrate lyase subunit beta/citryl-CoA lyase
VKIPLFVPGNDAVRIPKAFAGAADSVILDLEDAVATAEKAAARLYARDIVTEYRTHPVASWVRVNAFSTGLIEDDVATVVVDGLAGIVLPMAQTAADVSALDALISAAEQKVGLATGSIPIVPLIETAQGFVDIPAIVGASSRVTAAMFGPGDFTLDIGVTLTPQAHELDVVRTLFPIYCRSRGVAAIDGAYPFITDLDEFERTTQVGKTMGFIGRTALHPKQLAIAVAVYKPSAEELAWAARAVDAFAKAEAQGIASTTTSHGEFVDYPVAARAKALLDAQAVLDAQS